MKWVTTDYKGNPQVWYTGDVIEKIIKLCAFYVSKTPKEFAEKCDFNKGREHCALQVVSIIEREDNK